MGVQILRPRVPTGCGTRMPKDVWIFHCLKEVGMGLEILGKSHVLLIILIVAFTFYIYMQAFDFLDPYFGEFVI